ncbi:MAG: CPBP family intramembrane metalloprotease [Actinomycetota bacterium]|nr:CPBP family intramembrane metalloprotease [Actinomycetota bacterium]
MSEPEGALGPRDSENLNSGGVDGDVPWSVGDALTGVVLLWPVSLLVGLLIFLLGLIVCRLAGAAVPAVLKIVALGGATFIAGITLAWWLGIKRRGGSFADLGLTNMHPWFDIPIALLGEIVIFIGLATYGFVLFRLAGQKVPEQPVIELFGRTKSGFALAVIFVAVLAPIGEEVFFRGFVYSAFKRQWGAGTAIIASSLVFALFHIEPLLYVPMFLIGAILATLFEYRGSLAPNIALHALNNLLALLVLYHR